MAMKKQLYLLFLLLLSVQLAIAQTSRYEYWLDNGYQSRTVVANSATDVALNLDISNLKPGLHYFNVRAQGQSNQWGGLSRYLFFIREEADPTASFMTKYEYWLDNNYSGRTVVNGAATDVALNLDISNLKPGLHYFNVRAQGKSGQWGGLSRYLFFIREEADPTASSMTKYEYWLDNNYSERIVVNGAATDVALNLDISNLKPGLHYFNVRAQGKSGQWGGLSRYLFFIREEADANASFMTRYEYWQDNNYSNRTVVNGSVTDVALTLDISNLKPGLHYFNVRAQGKSGQWGGLSRYLFYLKENNAVGDLSSVEYWIDSRQNVMAEQVSSDEMVLTVDISTLSKGTHTFYLESVGSNGSRSLLDATEFTVETDPVVPVPEPYAVLSENNTVLTFYYDEHKEERNGMSIAPSGASSWYYQRESITKVVFDDTFEDYTFLTSTANWFYGCNYLTEIVGLDKLRTLNVTNMHGMFCKCFNLTSLDLSNFNTSNVTNMEFMFQECSSLTSLDLSNFNTSNVKEMTSMFVSCSGLTALDVSNFNTSNVTNMSSMFGGCSKLTSLDVSNFNTSNMTTMSSMFSGCSKLTTLDVSNFNTSNVTHMSGMFYGCSSLTSLDLSNFNTENVKDMSGMFSGCSGLTSLDLSNFNTSNVIYDTNDWYSGNGIRSMFEGCSALTTIWVSDGWTTANLTESPDVFKGCTSLVGGKGTHYDPDHIDYTYARIDGGPDSETPGYFTRKGDAPWVEPGTPEPYAVLSDNNTVLTFYYDTEREQRNGMSVGPFPSYSERGWHDQRESITNVVFDASFAECTTLTSTAHWFYGCENLASITDISNLRTDNVTRMRYMFRYCSKLTSLDVSGFKTDNVTDMRAMFSHCSSLTSLDVSGFNTENVTDMMDMFDDCSKLTTIDVSHFNTEKVTNMSVMFQSCTSLTSLDLTNFNTSNVTNTQGMFYGCSNLVNLDIRTFDMSKVNNEEKNMFIGCSSLASIIAGSANILTEEYANIGNPNLLVYVNEARVAPEGVQNVVVNGVAKEIVLTDNPDGKIVNNNWYCPEPFRAEKISYTREFRQQTQIGISRGWESLALPFAVQTITHQDKGAIAPFGSDASGLHFWLRRLGHEGLISVQMIEPNTPYIISMPNSEDYASRFNLNGRVTFAAEDAYVERTEQMEDESADYMMVPTFQRMPVSEYVYALNIGEERNGRPEGSIFERNYREVRPFEAYTLHRGDQPAPLFFDLSDLEGSTTDILEVRSQTEDGNGEWYDLQGRKLGSTLNVQRSTLKKGVYIRNGRKTVVK